MTNSFVHLARARKWNAKSKAIIAEQQQWQSRQQKLIQQCGKTRCELCERVAKLVTWDERQRPGETGSRQPIWRICGECKRMKSPAVHGVQGEPVATGAGSPWLTPRLPA